MTPTLCIRAPFLCTENKFCSSANKPGSGAQSWRAAKQGWTIFSSAGLTLYFSGALNPAAGVWFSGVCIEVGDRALLSIHLAHPCAFGARINLAGSPFMQTALSIPFPTVFEQP